MEMKMPITPKKMPGKKKVVGLRVSSDCNQGGRKYMEDVISIVFDRREDSDYACFAVYDGHGGRQAAVFARDHLWENIKKQRGFFTEDPMKVKAAIREGFIVTQAAMEKVRHKWPLTATGYPSTAGTTVAMVIINQNNMYVAHVGDSRIVAGVKNKHDRVDPKALTIDHKPSNRREIERIEKLGGQVLYKNGVPRVVWTRAKTSHKGPIRRSTHVDNIPFLAVARSLGDLWSYQFEHEDYLVSPDPDITHHIIDPEFHKFLVIGSDGLWNMMSVYDAVRHMDKYAWERANKGAGERMYTTIANQLVQTTINKWNARGLRADNTTAITIYFEFPDRLDDEDDQIDLASVRQWQDVGLTVTNNYDVGGDKPSLTRYTDPRKFNPWVRRKCWHYNFTAQANELCNVCRQIVEMERVRAYAKEQTVYMESPKGPWITAKRERKEIEQQSKKRKAEDEGGVEDAKKHKVADNSPEYIGAPNKEIMVKTVKGMVKVQIYGFGTTDPEDDEMAKKADDDKKEGEEDKRLSEAKRSELKDEEMTRIRQQKEAATKSQDTPKSSTKESPKKLFNASDVTKSNKVDGWDTKEACKPTVKAKETNKNDNICKMITSPADKKTNAVVSAPALRKSPRNSSKLTCLKDSNSVSPVIKGSYKSRPYNTRNSLSPKNAIKRPLRTVNCRSPGRRRTTSPMKIIGGRAVTRSAVKIR